MNHHQQLAVQRIRETLSPDNQLAVFTARRVVTVRCEEPTRRRYYSIAESGQISLLRSQTTGETL